MGFIRPGPERGCRQPGRLGYDLATPAMLSQKTRYAIRAMQHLADRHGEGPVRLAGIAEAQNIPANFLTVILSELSRATAPPSCSIRSACPTRSSRSRPRARAPLTELARGGC